MSGSSPVIGPSFTGVREPGPSSVSCLVSGDDSHSLQVENNSRLVAVVTSFDNALL